MKILLGITGSVAATLALKIIDELKKNGHEVQVVATTSSLYFLPKKWLIETLTKQFRGLQVDVPIWLNHHEWPGVSYVKNQEVKHIELRKWADLLLIAPITANTLSKMANGLANNLLTNTIYAWDNSKPIIIEPEMTRKQKEYYNIKKAEKRYKDIKKLIKKKSVYPRKNIKDKKPMIVAPAMNTHMWINPLTRIHLKIIKKCYNVKVINPVKKKLACGDIGKGAMASIETIIKEVEKYNPRSKQ